MELIKGDFNKAIEKAVVKKIDSKWKLIEIYNNKYPSMHQTVKIKGNKFDVFVKLGKREYSFDQFNLEAKGLDYITRKTDVKTPKVIDVLNIEGNALLILEAIDTKEVKTKSDWEILGRGLAKMHKASWDKCGLEFGSYLGVFKQDNRPIDNWVDFYGKRRLLSQLNMNIEKNFIEKEEIKLVEKLIDKLPEILYNDEKYSLLHGDPWPGNLIFDGKELVAIDCSIYYGNREIDIATSDIFTPVDEFFYHAYNEVFPLDKGFDERKELLRIYQWLGHVTYFGRSHIGRLMEAVRRYL